MSVREILAVPVALAAMFFLVLALASPLLLIEQASEDGAALVELRAAEAYVNERLRVGAQLPNDEELRRWAESRAISIASSVSTSPIACLGGFQAPKDDRFVLAYWAGEWSECLSSPSGETTLKPTLAALLRSGFAYDVAIYLALGLSLAWLAWVLGIRDRRVKPSAG